MHHTHDKRVDRDACVAHGTLVCLYSACTVLVGGENEIAVCATLQRARVEFTRKSCYRENIHSVVQRAISSSTEQLLLYATTYRTHLSSTGEWNVLRDFCVFDYVVRVSFVV